MGLAYAQGLKRISIPGLTENKTLNIRNWLFFMNVLYFDGYRRKLIFVVNMSIFSKYVNG